MRLDAASNLLYSISMLTKGFALRFHEFGSALEVLRCEEMTWPAPRAGEILVRVGAAPLHPADLGRVGGSYGSLPTLPAIGGIEGAGQVVEVGQSCDELWLGKKVLLPEGSGTWASHLLTSVENIFQAPEDLEILQSAMLSINPATAWLLLHEFVRLQDKDWILQNAATSAVGQSVIQLARHFGWKSINLVRRESQKQGLYDLGADAVVVEGPEAAREILAATEGRKPRLGLNSIGGQSALTVIKSLAEGGTMVTFGGMVKDPVLFPTRQLIFNDIHLRGFWLHHWKKTRGRESVRQLLVRLGDLASQGILSQTVAATYPLREFPQALGHAQSENRGGKVVFVPEETRQA